MVRLNVIYTRTGDRGETGLGDGSRRPKTDARVVAMGDVDEANCAVGLARLSTRGAAEPTLASIEPTLARIQNDLFDLGADLALPGRPDEAPGAALRVAPSQVEALERAIDALNAKLEPLRSFVLPAGSAAAAALHHARAVSRRAERSLVALWRRSKARPSGKRRSPMPTGCRTISLSPRARPMTTAGPTCSGFPGASQGERR